jgi:hypothetical protein
MKKVNAFITEDGKLHASEEAAKRHEIALAKHESIDRFLSSASNHYTATPQKAIARQSIINWELWKKDHAE